MITFNVGPSMISANTKQDIVRAAKDGVLELSHRSEAFTNISRQAVEGLFAYFNIPADYKVFYTASSTAAMQSALANCCQTKSLHFVNGSFSALSAQIAKTLHKTTTEDKVDFGQLNDFDKTIYPDVDFVALAHNETSSGVMCSLEDIASLRRLYPDAILAVDITSSAGAAQFEIAAADIWYFSVQKCFGLPAGLGIMIVSPRAFTRSLELSQTGHNRAGYFSFANMWEKMSEKYQTLETPNVLNIYLLAEKLKRWSERGGLSGVQALTAEKYRLIEEHVNASTRLDFFVESAKHRSTTSVCLKADTDYIAEIHARCQDCQLLLGKGYGPLKNTTVRIANFPAVTKEDLTKLFTLIA